MQQQVRVRFAPSPTGPLHIGGMRTALFNYLFARKHEGTFIVRIEDTDQTRFVEGAEQYIQEALDWCGITPDESPWNGGTYAPYRQSERKEIYRTYAQQLVDNGKAYYAFDTPEELEAMRNKLKEAKVANQQYNAITRNTMKNSLTLPAEEVAQRLNNGEPYVIRLKVPSKEDIRLNDLVRGWVKVMSFTLEDKILLKSDGMPTYHLANVVDDHLMKITHVIRGEEWLPSAPLHVLLYRYLGWEDTMPQFAHLPLLLKPSGNGKLSKRDGDKLGFAVFPLAWEDPNTHDTARGYREDGFLPEALVNFLALLGWNAGTEQEIFTLQELIEQFSLEKVSKAGAKFDIEKARWFNQQYLKNTADAELVPYLMRELHKAKVLCSEEKALQVVAQMKERVTYPHELWTEAPYFFIAPTQYDEKVARKKWTQEAVEVFRAYLEHLKTSDETFDAALAKQLLEQVLEQKGVKIGKVMQALRLALTGVGGGSDLMMLMEIIGKEAVVQRLENAISALTIQG